MSQVTVMMSGDDSRLRAVHEKLLRDQQKILDKYTKLASQSQKSAEIARKEASTRRALAEAEKKALAARARGKQLTEQSLTPQERLNKRIAELKRLREQGNISLQTATRLLRRYRAETQQEEQAIERSSKAYKRKTEAAREARSVIDRLRTSSERYRADLRKLVKAKREGIISSDELRKRHIQLREEFSKQGKMQGVTRTLSQIAGAYVGLQAGIQAATAAYQTKLEVQERSLEVVRELAKAEETASKNFAGLSRKDRKKLNQAAGEIQRQVGFPERKILVKALGTAQSAGADDKLTRKAVAELAPLSRIDTSTLEPLVLGTINTARALGTDNVRDAAGLLLGIGGKALVTDPKKLARAVGPVLQSAVGKLPNEASEQLKERAAISAGGLLAALTKAAGDDKGESSVTAFINMSQKLREFFAEIPDRIESSQSRLKELAAEEKVTAEEQDEIARRKLDVARAQQALSDAKKDPEAKTAKGKMDVREAEIDVRSAQREFKKSIQNATLSKEDIEERKQLRAQLAALQKFEQRSPVLVGKQIEALQQSSLLASLFKENAKEFGEARFQTAFEKLMDARSQVSRDFVRFTRGPGAIEVSSAEYEAQLAEQRGTEAMRTADFDAKSQALIESSQLETLKALKARLIKNLEHVSRENIAETSFYNPSDYITMLAEPLGRAFLKDRISQAKTRQEAFTRANYAMEQVKLLFQPSYMDRSTTQSKALRNLEELLQMQRDEQVLQLREQLIPRETTPENSVPATQLNEAGERLLDAANNMARPGAGANAQAGAAVGVGAQ